MASVEKLIRLHKSLITLSHGRGFIEHPRITKIKRIIKSCAEQLDVSRVSVWRLEKERQRIECEALFLLENGQFYQGAELFQQDFPDYFRAIAEDRIINADNAITDPRTREFTNPYLIPNGIHSMLDAPIFYAGELSGVICLEQVGSHRQWDMAEMSYVASLADNISIVNEHESWLQDREQLAFLEQFDPLTGLEKRNNFQKRLDFDLQDTPDPKRTRALVLIGLDAFGEINDRYGHKSADILLKAFANFLMKTTQPNNCRLARVGGDLFAIWLPDLPDVTELEVLLDQLKDISVTPILTDEEQEVCLSFSSGVVIYPTAGEPPASPMRCTELALQRAKEANRGSVCYFSMEWLEELQQRHIMEKELLDAFSGNQLQAFYQPVFCARTSRIIGLEALVRWIHPETGCIAPAAFLPLVKRLGLMERLGELMLNHACRDIKAFKELSSSLRWVSVNIASEQLYDPALASDIADILNKYELPADALELEIIEELISQDSSLIREQLDALSELGVRLAIDDFGTGYSSLSRLKHMPVSKLKIDKSFVDGLPDSEDDQCISQSIIGLAKGLKLELVAEGVENKSQVDYLKDSDCGYFQGYYFARPMPYEEIVELLQRLKE